MSKVGQYSTLDRFLHQVAFRSVFLQKVVADIEDKIFGAKMAQASISQPVFITSLPRAGTTLLLEVLSQVDEFAAHTYRDMPFVLCPLLWDQISGASRQDAELAPRAHGDGMDISFDSHEAFEEIIWKAFWSANYSKDHISVWDSQDRDPEFEHFLKQHMRKIITLRGDGQVGGARKRYISKNNGNVAKLRLLPAIFPDCKILVPIRNPQDHLQSLVRQHNRFNKIHSEDRFAYQYMDYLGHFEFGLTLRPIEFGGHTLDRQSDVRQLEPDFWLNYWINAYADVLQTAQAYPQIQLIDYDKLCAQPAEQLQRLAGVLGLGTSERAQLLQQASRLRAPTDYGSAPKPTETTTEQTMLDLYRRLLERTT